MSGANPRRATIDTLEAAGNCCILADGRDLRVFAVLRWRADAASEEARTLPSSMHCPVSGRLQQLMTPFLQVGTTRLKEKIAKLKEEISGITDEELAALANYANGQFGFREGRVTGAQRIGEKRLEFRGRRPPVSAVAAHGGVESGREEPL